ncbi:MAG: hypothetical protein HYZ53_13505 [Planctomycetes bacterium]|nr:hypothetical protein [Planctomycetota bacterium]
MKYEEELRRRLVEMKPTCPPSPWMHRRTIFTGGLTEVGFGPGTDLLLVVSHDGRGVFDCATGERVARHDAARSESWFDPILMTARGIGPLEGIAVPVAGLSGGGLPVQTLDQWSIKVAWPAWPQVSIFLQPPGSCVYDVARCRGTVRLKFDEVVEYLACGFSPTGKTLVIATSADVELFRRA